MHELAAAADIIVVLLPHDSASPDSVAELMRAPLLPGRAVNIRRIFQNHIHPVKTYILMHT